MTGNLLVTPDKLISTADSFDENNTEVRNITQNMIDTVNSLSATWAGEAATAYNTQFHKLEDDMSKLSSMIAEHANDLRQMAENYKAGETANVEAAGALSGDILS
ncbi:Uncharacterized protein conserved in bacteria [Butyrivibrio fibrisolvens 16/4]|nr:Uncharacterized protein conserved in bacteria [Butyrivibrio fibrisolvens 16/4]